MNGEECFVFLDHSIYKAWTVQKWIFQVMIKLEAIIILLLNYTIDVPFHVRTDERSGDAITAGNCRFGKWEKWSEPHSLVSLLYHSPRHSIHWWIIFNSYLTLVTLCGKNQVILFLFVSGVFVVSLQTNVGYGMHVRNWWNKWYVQLLTEHYIMWIPITQSWFQMVHAYFFVYILSCVEMSKIPTTWLRVIIKLIVILWPCQNWQDFLTMFCSQCFILYTQC